MWLKEEEMALLGYDELYRAILGVESTNLGKAFEFAKRVLCVQPHPDDTDFAAGGLIAKLTKRGCEVAYVTMTDGRIGNLDPSLYQEKLASVRVEEQKEAAEILGVKKLMWLNYRDSELKVTIEARNKLATLIREFQPDLILTVDPWLTYEAHPDHVATGTLAVEAAFFALFPHANPGDVRGGLRPHPTAFIAFYWTRKPNVYVDITDYMDVKLKAVSSHKSQYPPGGFEEVENLLKTYSVLMGKKMGVRYAEAFKVLSPLRHLHCCVYAEDL
ncbi:PIG-L family deacetylase [Candidatus Bathyarchaeota archaeon]|nr:PIG-L family deacetylase [Candidatus Bathyarchaeota archaeon]